MKFEMFVNNIFYFIIMKKGINSYNFMGRKISIKFYMHN